MSVPVVSGLTTIDRADNNTNWSGWGQNSGKWGTSSEFVKEGSASNALAPFQTGDGGWGYDWRGPAGDAAPHRTGGSCATESGCRSACFSRSAT